MKEKKYEGEWNKKKSNLKNMNQIWQTKKLKKNQIEKNLILEIN